MNFTLFLCTALLLIPTAVESDCSLKVQNTVLVKEEDFFKDQIPIDWQKLMSRRCVKQIEVDLRINNQTLNTTKVLRAKLDTLEGEPFTVKNRFGKCRSSKSYVIRIEVTNIHYKKFEITAKFDPLKQLDLFDATKSVKLVAGTEMVNVFWKRGGMFAKSQLLLKCLYKAQIFKNDNAVVKVIPQQSKEVSFPSEGLSFCDTYEVHYYFFKDTPKVKKANITLPRKEYCQNRASNFEQRRIPKCAMGWKMNASKIVDLNSLFEGQLVINWAEKLEFQLCVKTVAIHVENGGKSEEDSLSLSAVQASTTLKIKIDPCQPTHLSVNITDWIDNTENLDEVIDPLTSPPPLLFNSYENRTKIFVHNKTKRYNLIRGMFNNDKLREFCFEAVDIFGADGQKQRTVGKHDAANATMETDRCSNTNFTLLYKFKGSRNITVKLGILSKETCPSFIEHHAAFIGGMSVLIVTVVSIVAIVTFCMRKKKTPEAPRPDLNPVYGTYSRWSMEEGEYGDGDVVEAKDFNPYYEISS